MKTIKGLDREGCNQAGYRIRPTGTERRIWIPCNGRSEAETQWRKRCKHRHLFASRGASRLEASAPPYRYDCTGVV